MGLKKREIRSLNVVRYSVMVLFSLLTACGTKAGGAGDIGSDTFGPGEVAIYTDGEARAPDTPMCKQQGDPCADGGGFCFDVCGTQVLVQAPPSLSGYTVATALPANLPRAAARAEFGLVTIEIPNIVLREPETLAEIGAVPVGRANALAVVGAIAFVQDGLLGGVTVVDMGDPAHPMPMAWWAAATTPPPSGVGGPKARLRLVGASDGQLVVSTERGVSLLDVSDPHAPVEALCVPHAEGEPTWTAHVVTNGNWLVVTRALGGDEDGIARVHDLQAVDPNIAVAEFPSLVEGFVALHKGRLLLAVEGEAQLYELAAPGGPAMIAVRALSTNVPFDAPVVGGFAMVCNAAMCSAFDLESEDLAVYTVEQVDAQPCLERLLSEEGGTEWVVSPQYSPDQRWPVEESPIHSCPAAAEQSPLRAFDGVLSPGGDEILVHADGGDWLVNLDDGTTTAVAGLSGGYSDKPFPSAVWVGDRIAMLTGGPGGDWGIIGNSLIEIHDRQLLDGPPISVDSPGTILDLAAGGQHLYVLSEPAERAFGDPAPTIAERVLWSVELGAAMPSRTDLPLPGGALPTGLAATGETLYVLDAEAGIRVLDSAGNELRTVAVPENSVNGPHVAGPGGLLVRGGDGVPRWLPAGGESLLVHVDGCAELVPVATDGGSFHFLGRFPGSPDFASRWDLIVATPVPKDDGFVFEVDGSAPLGQSPTRVLPGDPTVIIDNGLVLLQ
jgi:hypothetical protein